MGIYDRAWYREAQSRRRASMTSAVKVLIVVNVICYLLTGALRAQGWDPVDGGLGMVPEHVVGKFFVWQIVTSMFLHGGLFHLFFNMFVLWMFGAHVERRLGPKTFYRFYFGAGILSGIAYVVVGLFSAPFMPAVGASGAIMGVMVYFTMLNPNATVFFMFLIPMRMVWAMTLIVGIDLYYFVFAPPGGTGIAHTAHLGGALFGYLYYRYAHRIDRFFLSLEMRSARRKSAREDRGLSDMEEEVERLLEKIHRGGLDSLSEEERRYLREAS
ncbi:MAG: rhomboid family intramembrane serine protease, partial [Planctomycetota bacterium]